jgi:uncharacterized protein (TIGR03084 family)
MKQASYYQKEVNALSALLSSIDDEDLYIKTPFKQWTINDVIGHLFVFDTAALLTLNSEVEFDAFFSRMDLALKSGHSFLQAQQPYLVGLSGRELVHQWLSQSEDVFAAYSQADPKLRLKWAGPSMSARSSITARHMETWAHGHSVFDALQQIRSENDGVHSICHLGVATFGWTFTNRKIDVPKNPPIVELSGPSGAHWVWNPESENGAIRGKALEFAQIVTQVRNVHDTSLKIEGDIACKWMSMAQCFAGPAVDPPISGSRLLFSR